MVSLVRLLFLYINEENKCYLSKAVLVKQNAELLCQAKVGRDKVLLGVKFKTFVYSV